MKTENCGNTFTILLNQYVEDSSLSKNELIHLSTMDRSSFFQVLRGKRTPTQEQLKALGAALQLPDKEQEKMQELLLRAVLGEQVWQNRQEVIHCLHTLANSNQRMLYPTVPPQVACQAECIPQGCLITGKENVQHTLRQILGRAFTAEHPSMDIFIPATEKDFFDFLHALAFDYHKKNVQIRHLVQFPTGKEILNTMILQEFNNMLFFWSINCEGYQVSYYYDSSRLENSFGVAFPYYLLLEDCAVLVSADFKQAFLTSEPELCKAQRRNFEKAMENAHSIVLRFADMQEYETTYERTLAHAVATDELLCAPCAAAMATKELLEKYIPDKVQSEWTWQHCQVWQKNLHCREFISLEGLQEFAYGGLTPELKWLGIEAVTPEDRLTLLKSRRDTLQKSWFLLDKNKLSASRVWDIMVWENEAVLMFNYAVPDSLRIVREKNIACAFTDFLHNLPESDMVMPPIEAEKALENLIEELQAQLPNKNVSVSQKVQVCQPEKI